MIFTINVPVRGRKVTNGDVIKSVFPNIEIFEENEIHIVWGRSKSEAKWWNKPYKGASELPMITERERW